MVLVIKPFSKNKFLKIETKQKVVDLRVYQLDDMVTQRKGFFYMAAEHSLRKYILRENRAAKKF